MCMVLKASRSWYYKSLGCKLSQAKNKRRKIVLIARKFHERSNGIYGYRKVLEDIRMDAPELTCAPETLRLIMASEALFSCIKRKHRYPPMEIGGRYRYADNELDRDFKISTPNKKWVADITYIRTASAGSI